MKKAIKEKNTDGDKKTAKETRRKSLKKQLYCL